MKETPRTKKTTTEFIQSPDAYPGFAGDIATLLDEARRQAARSVNAILTATYWERGLRARGLLRYKPPGLPGGR